MISQEGSRVRGGKKEETWWLLHQHSDRKRRFFFPPSQLIKPRVWWGKAGPWAGRTVASGCFRLDKPSCVMTEGSKKPTSVSGKFPLTPSIIPSFSQTCRREETHKSVIFLETTRARFPLNRLKDLLLWSQDSFSFNAQTGHMNLAAISGELSPLHSQSFTAYNPVPNTLPDTRTCCSSFHPNPKSYYKPTQL